MAAAAAELDLSSLTSRDLINLSNPIREALARTVYNPLDGNPVSIKSMLESLLPSPNPQSSENTRREVIDFCLLCAALASAEGEDTPHLYWIPKELSFAGRAAMKELSEMLSLEEERVLVERLMSKVFPLMKGAIKESCVDPDDDVVLSSSAKAPVAYAIVAAHQFRWFVTQVGYPHLGKLCSLAIPCALTALDHWSPEVKEQGMVCFIHLAKNVNSAELCWFEDPILDACCQNIASSDEIWHRVVEMSVLSLTSILQRNPRSPWYERVLTEMLDHLERQPMNKNRRTAWLLLIEPVLESMGLVLLAHFRRIFPLLFHWLHLDDDETIILVLERMHTIIKLTWIRRSPYFDKLVDELTLLYKEAAMKKDREAIRSRILQILILLKQCKGLQFETAWDKHKNDVNLSALAATFS